MKHLARIPVKDAILTLAALVAVAAVAWSLLAAGPAPAAAAGVGAPAHMTGTPYPHPTGTEHWPPPTRTARPEMSRTPLPPPERTGTPQPPPHRPLLRLLPRVQFGHAAPGETAVYHEVLQNRIPTTATVDLSADSIGGWDVAVDPTQIVTEPGMTDTVAVSVSVPVSPTWRFDIERVQAQAEPPSRAGAVAYFITLTGHPHFSDVPPDSWEADPVAYLVGKGVLSGYADGTFHPNADITRAQFAKMLVSAEGWALVTPQTPTFADVPATFWGYSYVETAVAHGVIAGYPDGTFRPNADLTRAQLAKMVAVGSGWSNGGYANPFHDVGTGDWFYDYAVMANAADVISGYADGTFRPYAPATRAQVAKILTYGLFSDPQN